MRRLLCLILALLGLVAAVEPALCSTERRVIRATAVASPPVVDGDLSDPVWRQAGVSGGFRNDANGAPATQPSLVYALSDADHLYLAFRCAEPEPGQLKANIGLSNASIWGDDCIEMNFDPAGGMGDIYQFTVNSIGTVELDTREYGHQSLQGVRAAARVGEREWTAELVLPFAAVGIDRSPGVEMHWRVNFERLRTAGGEEDDYWQDTTGEWANPDNYGTLIIPGRPLVVEGVGHALLKAGFRSGAFARLSNRSATPRDLKIEVTDMTGGRELASAEVTLRARQGARLDLDFPVEMGGERLHRWVIRDQATGATLYSLQRLFKTKKAIEADLFYHSREIVADVDTTPWGELPSGTRVEVELVASQGRKALARATATVMPKESLASAVLKVGDLPAGDYEVRAVAKGRGGASIGAPLRQAINWPQSPSWPSAPQGIKVLNNFVSELLNVEPSAAAEQEYRFFNPREGWVFLALTSQAERGAEVRVTLDDGGEPVIVSRSDGPPVAEAMRRLPEGPHTLRLRRAGPCRLDRIVVRAVPELQYFAFPINTPYPEFGPYDWQFLSRHVLPQISTIIGEPAGEDMDRLQAWRKNGGRWIIHGGVPGMHGPDIAAEDAEEHWLQTARLGGYLADGIIIDEFFSDYNRNYPGWTGAVRRLKDNPAFRGVTFYPYCNSMYFGEQSTEFMRAVFEGDGYAAWIRYLAEQPTEAQARREFRHWLYDENTGWEKVQPGVTQRTVVVLGYFDVPPGMMDVNPGVDYKTAMDMQFRLVANSPQFWGLYGVQEWSAGWADEETVRWGARLYRHYCIEGNTEPLTKDPYLLTHLENPDFADGLKGWNVEAAEPDSVTADSWPGSAPMTGYSWLEGRFSSHQEGDTFLLMRRSARKPNVVRQTIRNLEPGRLYSLRMITGDHRDMSEKVKHAVSVEVEGAETLPDRSFQEPFANGVSPPWGGYSSQRPAWMNFHWRVLRATGAEATLRISDWVSDTDPGGPIGQELMFNFVEVQPYFPE